jgi:zinc metalloprotease ZmpB
MITRHNTAFAIAAVITLTAVAFSPAPAQTGSRVQYAGSMRLDEKGTPRALFNLSVATSQHSPELAARSFLGSYKQILHLNSVQADLVTDDVMAVPGGSHVRFHQTFSGLPVYGSDVVVSVNARNEITMVINNARADIEAPTTPSFNSARALAIARDHLKTSDRAIGQDDAATLTIFADEQNAYHLAYLVTMTREAPAGDWEVLIDAQDGTILRSTDRFVDYEENQVANGSGYAYLTDPLSAAHQKYGAPGFSDNNDQDSDSLSAYRSLVALDSITYSGGHFTLRGPFCTIMDIESPFDSAIVSPTPDGFQFNRSQPGFEAVNAYYHVSQAYKRVRELGFASARLQKIRIDPHGFQGQDNSHYSPSGNWIAFGTGGVDDAEDADVIWHEYGHAIQYSFSPTWGGGETAALGEGYSDYWAASHSRAVSQWTPADDQFWWVYKWDGHNSYWSGRRVDDTRMYPFESASPHVAGQVWSSALMGIRQDLGRDVTDRLVLKSIFYLGYGSTAVDAANAVIQADRDLYNGTHIATLVYWLGTVKRFLDAATIQNLATGVEELQETVPASFRLDQNYPNPFNPTTTLRYFVGGVVAPSGAFSSGVEGPDGSHVKLAVYDMLGREVEVLVNETKEPGNYSVTWNAAGMASGVYLCRLDVAPADGSSPLSFTRKMALLR